MASIKNLTQINLDDLVSSFGWEQTPVLSAVLRSTFKPTARKFARMMLHYNEDVRTEGLGQASKKLLTQFAASVTVFGSDNIPTGPVLVLSNHPGMVDTLALFTALGQQDLRIIARQRPFLEALTNVRPQLLFINDVPGEMIGLLKTLRSHLDHGGAVLTFPAGEIDPDPSVYSGSIDALAQWTDSAGVIMRLSPDTALLPVVVQGVIWEKTAHLPLLRAIRRQRKEREKLATALQLISHVSFGLHPLHVVIQIGKPVQMSQAVREDKAEVHRLLLQAIRGLITDGPQGEAVKLI